MPENLVHEFDTLVGQPLERNMKRHKLHELLDTCLGLDNAHHTFVEHSPLSMFSEFSGFLSLHDILLHMFYHVHIWRFGFNSSAWKKKQIPPSEDSIDQEEHKSVKPCTQFLPCDATNRNRSDKRKT
ncbi:hypothetical protein NPIL_337801 [Nephila pilipes]|uniref:Uncharacterized protein n=1 Tax=Nephila pilipes TaxID=299642 RepID=A0A8X6Q1S6_NEPPI|nr:hypothetical protein NPIL_337801 [Nephila pilipes]